MPSCGAVKTCEDLNLLKFTMIGTRCKPRKKCRISSLDVLTAEVLSALLHIITAPEARGVLKSLLPVGFSEACWEIPKASFVEAPFQIQRKTCFLRFLEPRQDLPARSAAQRARQHWVIWQFTKLGYLNIDPDVL